MWKVQVPGMWSLWDSLPGTGAASPAQHERLGLRGCQGQEPALAPPGDPEEATEYSRGLGPSAHGKGGNGIILKVPSQPNQEFSAQQSSALAAEVTLPLIHTESLLPA